MQIVVNGLLVQYSISGSGKLVVYLHGWGDTIKGSLELQRLLSKDFTVLAVDLPGFGGTQSPPTVWGLTDYALFVSDFLAKLELKSFAIIGHSNGGAIAVRGLADKKLKASKLILLASAGIRNEYKGRNHALRMFVKTGKVLTSPLPAATKRKLRAKTYAAVGSDMLVAEHLQETFKQVVTDDVQDDAAKLKLPTLLIYGDDDQATPIRYANLLHEAIVGSVLEFLPATGHFLHVEKPEIVAHLIEDFLS